MDEHTANQSNEPLRVIVDNIESNPKCDHGPTLLFVRGQKKFFACSAYRNRKYCNFHLTEREWLRGKKRSIRSGKVDKIKKIRPTQICNKNRNYCHTCMTRYGPEEVTHAGHDVQKNLPKDLLKNPSKILRPLEDNKKEAQYFFTDETVAAIVNIFLENDYKRIVCIGTPKIHEFITNKCGGKDMKSYLLDIDHRFGDFFETNQFSHYNLFNDHFFHPDGEENFKQFLKENNSICCIMDPPFGGRVEPMRRTFEKITFKYNQIHGFDSTKIVPVILVLPYFMEPFLKVHIEELNMSDYQVTYTNHNSFKNKFEKKGSPVRLFTSIPLKNISLPVSEGYKFCRVCEKWTGEWNAHCRDCDACASKNGTTYVHCVKCKRCVKHTWRHCERCDRCSLASHECEIKFVRRKMK